ncbi:solute carrier family 15 member 4-like [Amphiura filiformis]|uniref:solute carrier family 15 member 4-like n=1 Tax=Amphiura filiformis TaxID=82378 RepID=UPI003B212034
MAATNISDKSPLVNDDSDANAISHYSSLSINPDIEAKKRLTPPTPPTTPPSLLPSGRLHTRLSLLCILFCELCERLTFYSISGNLVLFCTSELGFTSDSAATISLVFSGTAFFSPVFGGWFADSIAGKYNTIYGGLLVYIIGAALLPIISIHYEDINPNLSLSDSAKQGYFIFALVTIAIGTGGIKANVGPFGAQQLDNAGEKAVQIFFNWFYWFINVGTVLSFSFVVFVQQTYGFALGYTIPAVSIVISLVLLLVGKTLYILRPPEGSPMTTVTKVVVSGVSQCGHPNETDPEPDTVESCIDHVKERHGGMFPDQTVEDVKTLGGILPIFATIIFYWTVNFQTQTTFILQGERLKLKYGEFTLPVASLNLFSSISILLLIPVVDRLIYPVFEELGKPLKLLQRIGIGMVLVSIAAVIAAIVEMSRKNIMQEGGWEVQILAGESFNASTLSVFVQIPEYMLVGASEVFTSIAGLEFAYSQSPTYMQGIVMGMWLATIGLGNYVGSLYVTIVNSVTRELGVVWFPDEINDGYLEYYFFLIAGINLIDFGIFLLIAKRYNYVKQNDPDIDTMTDREGERTRELGTDQRIQ